MKSILNLAIQNKGNYKLICLFDSNDFQNNNLKKQFLVGEDYFKWLQYFLVNCDGF